MSKKRTMRELRAFMDQRAIKLRLWMNMRGLTPPALAEKIGVTPPRMRDYLDGAFIPASRLRELQKIGVPASILYLDGKYLHEMVIGEQ